MLPAFAAALAGAVLVVSMGACGGDDFESPPPKPCNEDPWVCGSGQTCWVNQAGTGFECLNAGPGAEGAACDLTIGAVACQAGLFCNTAHVCGRFCDSQDPEKACPEGLMCAAVGIQNPETLAIIGDVELCVP